MGKKMFWDGEWESVELIGKGSYGSVYKVRKTNTELEVLSAIKEICIPHDSEAISTFRTEGMTLENIDDEFEKELSDLKKEIKALYKFKDSINIVNIEDYRVEEIESSNDYCSKTYKVYIRMELLESITSLFFKDDLKDKEVLKMAIDIATALEELEENKFIHRDIKPENIFVNKNGVYKLGDFGEAKQLNRTLSNVSIRGTEHYMAPELLGAKKVDKTVDIYSLGIVLYRFFNDKKFPFYPTDGKPISAKTREEARYRRYSGETLPKPVNANDEVARIILKMCDYDVENRYKNASELKADLTEAYNNIKRAKNIFNIKVETTSEKTEPSNEEEPENKTMSLYARKKNENKSVEEKGVETAVEASDESEEIEEDKFNKTLSLYGNRKRVTATKKDIEEDSDSEIEEEPEEVEDSETAQIEDYEEVVDVAQKFAETLGFSKDSNSVELASNYDYVLFLSKEEANKNIRKQVKIRPNKELLIPVKDGLKDRDIFKVKQDDVIKEVLLVVLDKPSTFTNRLNSNLSQEKLIISVDEAKNGCVRIVTHNGKQIVVKVPPFEERKKVFLLEKGDFIFKLLVEQQDARYKKSQNLVVISLIICTGISFLMVGEIFVSFLLGFIATTILDWLIFDKITKESEW